MTEKKNAHIGSTLDSFLEEKGRQSSCVLQAVLETAKGLAGSRVMEPDTLREFEKLCAPSVPPKD